jgi:hypothetical protein
MPWLPAPGSSVLEPTQPQIGEEMESLKGRAEGTEGLNEDEG